MGTRVLGMVDERETGVYETKWRRGLRLAKPKLRRETRILGIVDQTGTRGGWRNGRRGC